MGKPAPSFFADLVGFFPFLPSGDGASPPHCLERFALLNLSELKTDR
jgi:hypothetical protein